MYAVALGSGAVPEQDIIVVGAGGHAKVVIATARAAGRRVVAVFDDRTDIDVLAGVPIAGPVRAAAGRPEGAVIAIGHNATRERLATELDVRWTAVVHPAAVVDESVAIAEGAVVFAGVVLQPDARVGCHAIVNTGATIDHDCAIGDFAHVAPGVHLCGNVSVGRGALIGVGACARPGVRIGDRAVVGAGAAVVSDLAGDATYTGCPARRRD